MPKTSMPNGRSGILLGQQSFINRLVYCAVPKPFLIVGGTEVPEDVWGYIVTEKHIDLNGEVSNLCFE